MTTEVSSQDWKRLCEHINGNSQGTLVSIEQGPSDGATSEVVSRVPLQTISLDEQSNACSNLLVIEAGTDKPVRHEVVEPIHVLLKRGDNGRFNQLEIMAESGRTLVHFAPGLKPMAAARSDAVQS